MPLAPDQLLELEALIFASGGPATPAYLKRAFPRLTPARIAEAVKELNRQLGESGRPYEIAEVSGGYQFRTRAEFGPLLQRVQPERKVRLSRPALETLSVIAYKQPITRAEIEDLRCVDCGAVLKSLLERNLVRVVGRRDAPGRPALYGTSANFLEIFGLSSLRDLPELREVMSLDETHGTPIELASGASEPDGGPEDAEAAAVEDVAKRADAAERADAATDAEAEEA